MASNKKYAYSEIFYSFQGEGRYTGTPSAWLRFFNCSLKCEGFGQKDPTDPSTYQLPYKELDVSQFTDVNQLPVFKFGCDSSYSWSREYAHLQKHRTAREIAESLVDITPKKRFDGLIDLCITGGEPLMKHSQRAIIEIMGELEQMGQKIRRVTFETNATMPLLSEFIDFTEEVDVPLFFSMSPKLFTVSGEKAKDAIKLDVIRQYIQVAENEMVNQFHDYQLKFVVSGTQESWDELDDVLEQIKQNNPLRFDEDKIWIMPLGATVEGLKGEISGHIPESVIATETIRRGWKFAARVHAHIFGNRIGT